ncbi:hypothetical protein DACRYDRAFT_89866 [Dacryopinax primogenitus]|uniref:Uncharacterized protein n=1 Tax=Dacryopinax primogenitus (strain DJM 731) TaxID=1858805 RepID=M5G9B0_DACPD|nr:uncharacterized protein DACRYDRAFT_89866 [Dacryopinax primogenitus]EJU00378.1 hypothetical protein DACRYDRAFT_89866 [Dacryopinax primogenitus]
MPSATEPNLILDGYALDVVAWQRWIDFHPQVGGKRDLSTLLALTSHRVNSTPGGTKINLYPLHGEDVDGNEVVVGLLFVPPTSRGDGKETAEHKELMNRVLAGSSLKWSDLKWINAEALMDRDAGSWASGPRGT